MCTWDARCKPKRLISRLQSVHSGGFTTNGLPPLIAPWIAHQRSIRYNMGKVMGIYYKQCMQYYRANVVCKSAICLFFCIWQQVPLRQEASWQKNEIFRRRATNPAWRIAEASLDVTEGNHLSICECCKIIIAMIHIHRAKRHAVRTMCFSKVRKLQSVSGDDRKS